MKNNQEHTLDSLELSKIFHEIRNPLTLINSSLQLIQDDHPEVKEFRFWKQTMKEIQNLRFFLDDLSTLQKGITLHITKINLFDFTEDLLESTAGFLLETGTPLTLECDIEDLDFYADDMKLRQAIVNLLKNAAESSSVGSPIVLKITAEENTLSFLIKDHGCGIDFDDLKHIFEPFHTTKSYGTGLGLPIVKKIVEAHHGLIGVDTVEGFGTTFGIYLPIP